MEIRRSDKCRARRRPLFSSPRIGEGASGKPGERRGSGCLLVVIELMWQSFLQSPLCGIGGAIPRLPRCAVETKNATRWRRNSLLLTHTQHHLALGGAADECGVGVGEILEGEDIADARMGPDRLRRGRRARRPPLPPDEAP